MVLEQGHGVTLQQLGRNMAQEIFHLQVPGLGQDVSLLVSTAVIGAALGIFLFGLLKFIRAPRFPRDEAGKLLRYPFSKSLPLLQQTVYVALNDYRQLDVLMEFVQEAGPLRTFFFKVWGHKPYVVVTVSRAPTQWHINRRGRLYCLRPESLAAKSRANDPHSSVQDPAIVTYVTRTKYENFQRGGCVGRRSVWDMGGGVRRVTRLNASLRRLVLALMGRTSGILMSHRRSRVVVACCSAGVPQARCG